jgi:hypothetical protein
MFTTITENTIYIQKCIIYSITDAVILISVLSKNLPEEIDFQWNLKNNLAILQPFSYYEQDKSHPNRLLLLHL